ncbi:MAG: hypothetical protein KA603_10925 [Azonexus sp.]|nr:hypothetical protein [Betaproteobacteria bacterium]MBK8916785.1 hypothetical protein [Betaproteobacteria bacterium]MBP6036636.1 hypothetical protein [Azonexus sp.]MBP6907245.1 hypothetical protein [Azonexus sp.]
MLIVRILAILAVIAIGVGFVAYAFTGDRRYLGFAWRLARWGLLFILVFLGLLFFERVLLIPL